MHTRVHACVLAKSTTTHTHSFSTVATTIWNGLSHEVTSPGIPGILQTMQIWVILEGFLVSERCFDKGIGTADYITI